MDSVDASLTMSAATSSTTTTSIDTTTSTIESPVIEETTTEISSNDTVRTSLDEEQTTFIIKGVLDPRDDKSQLSLQQAIMLGIVDQTNNKYINPNNGQTISMTDAMNEGRIMMEIVSRKKIREEKNSYGLITIKITKESRPYTITGVIDPATDEKISVAQASEKKILDMHSATYKTEKGEKLAIADAIHSGLVLVEYHGGETANHKPEVVEKTYAVHGVVDQKLKKKVSFSDAVRDGLLDKDTGEYVNNETGAKTAVHEAIMRGFIKARIVADPTKLEVNPENVILVEKMNHAKTKLKAAVKMAKGLGRK